MSERRDVFIHDTADVSETSVIGAGTHIWHQAQVMPGASIGENCNIGKGVFVAAGVTIGNNVKIQNYVSIYNGVTVEDDVLLGPHMTFTNDLYPRAFINDYTVYETLVKRGASVGANATIVCGVTLNEYCIVAAGAVIVSNVPAFTLVTGNPGRVMGYVCRCGKRLDVDKAPRQGVGAAPVQCKSCGKAYELPPGLIPML
jgi:UDP-2-acetamido-3-amino-2,3-dideoxy-glucuronate N-acetyltransferase